MAEEGEQIDLVARILAGFPVDAGGRADGLGLHAGVGVVVFVEGACRPHTVPMLDFHGHEAIHLALSMERAGEANEKNKRELHFEVQVT